MKWLYFFYFYFAVGLVLYAQEHRIDTLLGVIKEEKIYHNNQQLPGAHHIIFNQEAIQQHQNLSIDQFLQRHTSVFIRSSGINSNATLNIRGSSAAQNSVLWHGININNAALGATDLSLIPTGLFNQINLIMGSNTTLLGNGSTGGTLLLGNDLKFYKHHSLNTYLHTNTLQNTDGQAKYTWGNKKWFVSIGTDAKYHNNTFQYENDISRQEKMLHANFKTMGLQSDIGYLLKSTPHQRQQLSSHIWVQDIYREIPRALFEPASTKQQKTKSQKYLSDYLYQTKRSTLNIKTAYLYDKFHYSDIAIFLDNTYITQQIQSSITYTHKHALYFSKKWDNTFFADIPLNLQSLHDNDKNSNHFLSRLAGVVSYSSKHRTRHHQWALNIRQEWNSYAPAPFLPQLQTKWRLWTSPHHIVALSGSIQKTYRLPTLNEWYFFPGGNPLLKPEHGWGQELGLDYQWEQDKKTFLFKSIAFNRTIHDWIYWLGGSIWTPHNIATVNSQGIELYLNPTYRPNNSTTLTGSWNTTFTRATTQASYIPNDKSIDKQIPYSPRLVHQMSLSGQYQHWLLIATGQYIGYRFITTDESDFIDDYFIAQISLQKKWMVTQKKNHVFRTSIYIDNFTNNKRYQAVNGRPMPPMQIGITAHYMF
jgi:vitamin B12 transporter